ncbi:Protein kinase-like domain protein [Cordyceps fumosorosea ARSEF 2679]|uniref:non-specific serine/threonine protein kinase n=1 Tax=Cordyceps fumosorosea (strain ARSEF 2679) TaxID=1081104 RepID=A0A167ZL80_CORFA|nr:Protein kinase-like domain protein [Cordyceps fumosorosea ARSEF 2679]OAA67647.1 Protein kinase-like domain protein [Cordyceps fumosorosea ARSEF 2679]
MEYIELLDLETNLSLGKDGKVPQIEARAITRQILEGLQIMHAESFAHRDLKPQNIMVVRGPPCWRVKLADFGLSKRLTDGSTYNSRIGTQAYMAPEVYGYDNPHSSSIAYTNAVDLWAVGCIVYRLVTGTVPFQTGELRRVCENESKCPSETLGKEVGETCTGFIRLLLSKDPRDRPSAAGALKNTWITAGPVPEMTSCTSSEGASPEEYYRKLFEPQLARAKACMQDQRHTDAINILEPVVEAQKDTLEEKDKVRLGAEMYLAISYIAADRRVRNAIDILEPVVKVLRENFEKYEDRETCESQLAIAYIQEKQPAHAIQILERLVAPQKGTKEKDKPRLSYHFQLGIAYLQNNQIEEAITALEHVVAVQKEILNEEELVRLVPELWLARAYLSNSNVEGAVKLFEHLVEVTERILPQADELRLSGEQGLGVAYHNAGRYRDAVKVLERVVAVQREIFDETDPTRLEFEDLLATAYQSRQRPEEAIKLAAFFY